MNANVSSATLSAVSPLKIKACTDEDRIVGVRIAALRRTRGHSQTALGQAIGVTFQQVQKYEKGTNRVGAGRLQAIARFLEVPVGTFYDEQTADAEGGTNEVFAFLGLDGAIGLLRAYAEIESAQTRSTVLTIVKAASKIGASAPAEVA